MGKTSFLMEKSWGRVFKSLPADQVKALINAIFSYQNDEDIEIEDPVVMAVFDTILPTFEANRQRYEEKCEKNKENALKRTQANANDRCESERTQANAADIISYHIISDIDTIVEYLNQRCNTRYKATTRSTIKSIHGRINDGYTVDDFKTVIDKKADEWMGTEFEKHLNPKTLFRPSNFERYLNQRVRAPDNQFNMEDWINGQEATGADDG